MKAIILAAGKGSRLGNITNLIPKPMLKFNGKPLLQHNIELCKYYGITDLYINTHHLSSKITEYFENNCNFNISITYSYEKELLGTSGAIKNFQPLIGNEPFYVLYGDNISQFDLSKLQKKSSKHNNIATIGLYYKEDVSASGVAELDTHKQRIIKFIEKPKPHEIKSHWVNTGIYFLQPEIFEYIPTGLSDFGKNIFPMLLKKNIPIYGLCSNEKILTFDTQELYLNHQKE